MAWGEWGRWGAWRLWASPGLSYLLLDEKTSHMARFALEPNAAPAAAAARASASGRSGIENVPQTVPQ